MKVNRTDITRLAEGITLPALVVLIWYIVTARHLVMRDLLPGPGDVFAAFREILDNGAFTSNLRISVFRVLKGFLVGSGAGYVLGIILGMSKVLEKMITPFFNAVRQVPLPAWAPLMVLVSHGEFSQVLFISIGASYPVVLNTFEGVRSVRAEYLEVARVYRFDRVKTFLRIFLPASFPSVLTGLRLSMSISWMAVVAAEIFMTSGGGMGEMMWAGRELSRMDIVFVCIITIALVGFSMTRLMRILEKTFSFWRITMKQSQ
jgi:sulfonate transport system permease protein